MERDSIAELEDIREAVLAMKSSGAIVVLYSPYKYYSITDGKVDTWEMPNAVARLTSRDFLLVVKSRREPEVV